MFHTYLDFIRLSVTALLTGLPHAPRNFTDTLHSELHFAKDVSPSIITCRILLNVIELISNLFISE